MKQNLTAAMLIVFLASTAANAADQAASGWRAKVTAFAADNLKHPAWGLSHSQRDYALARSMAAADHIILDDDILFAAAYLHDMAAFAPWAQDNKDHADVAAEKVDTVLAGTDFPMAKMDALRAAIRTHMWARDPAGPEARYLHDADALDWLGAIGIGRQIALIDKKGGRPSGPEVIKVMEDQMANVPAHVVTPAGKALIAPRIAEEKAFFDALRRETDNLARF
jgi:uncharacterized protein